MTMQEEEEVIVQQQQEKVPSSSRINKMSSKKRGRENVLRSVERAMSKTDFDSYLPSRYPVLSPEITTKEKQQQVNVRFLMGSKPFSQSEYLVEGIERSAHLKLVSLSRHDRGDYTTWNTNSVDSNHPMVWMVDVESLELDCHVMEGIIKHVQQHNTNSEEENVLPTALVLMDYSGTTERLHCPHLEKLVPKERIRMTRRNLVQNRFWDPTKEWVEIGELSSNDGDVISGGPILFSPYLLRDSFVYGLSLALKKIKWKNNGTSPADLKRERDIAHFWRRDDYSHYSFLRTKVSAIVESLSGEHSNGRKIHTVVKILGEVEDMEQSIIQMEYIEQMIFTKIIVVAQRDEWEGHLRLLEALASGAMVIADKALAMPSGLVDRESIVLYDSAQSLKDAIFYYLNPKNDKERLSIARKGWETAMGRHRSWHRVEEILFGKPLTQADRPFESTPARQKRQIPKRDEARNVELFGNEATATERRGI